MIEPEFTLDIEGLAANKKFLAEQREAGNPDYKYHGNCTKAFADRIVDINFDRMWTYIKSIALPSRLEKPITNSNMENEIKTLIRDNKSWKARSCLVRNFHIDTFNNSNRNGYDTPNDYWKRLQSDRDLFKKFYHNRLRCSDWFNEFRKGKEDFTAHWKYLLSGDVPDFILAIGLDTSRKCPLVSYFKPALAKYLVKTYLNEFNEVGDCFSGMSGRLLGTLAAGKKYIGFDLNAQVVKESHDLMSFAEPHFEKYLKRKPEWSINVADATTNKFSCESVLCCSPYGVSEIWNSGSIKSELTCDDWIDVVLNNVSAKRYVFVTDDNIVKYRSYIKEQLDNFSHFGTNYEDIVIIDKT